MRFQGECRGEHDRFHPFNDIAVHVAEPISHGCLYDVFDKLPVATFRRVVIRAGIISIVVFSLSAILGDIIFRVLLQAEFASFQVFGGVVFLMIALRFVFDGNTAIKGLRGESRHIAGSIAMPLMIGPGTIGARIVVGKRLTHLNAVFSIVVAVLASVGLMIVLKYIHDYVSVRTTRAKFLNCDQIAAELKYKHCCNSEELYETI